MKAVISGAKADKIAEQQNKLARDDIPVLIIFEGGSGRVVSRVVNEMTRTLEPRFVTYHQADMDSPGATAFANLMKGTPSKGEVVLMDRAWYSAAVKAYAGVSGEMEKTAEFTRDFEEYFQDNGTRIIKILLDCPAEALEKYVEEYRSFTPLTRSFLAESRVDRVKFEAVMKDLVPLTDTERCPWNKVKVGPLEETCDAVADIILAGFKDTLSDGWRKPGKHVLREEYPNPRVNLLPSVEPSGFKKRMEALSADLERLQLLLSLSDRSLVLCFEGWDAAGKGGCIKHISHALDPRGYVVDRVKKPTSVEIAHTHLWRFADYVPAPGHISMFDRTWYGRMLVEPIEGFCTPEEYARSADEINMFEYVLAQNGVIVLKFWLDVSAEEQARRFADRKTNPLKTWKFTEEDERNSSKRDVYAEYIDRMIATTNTPLAPWYAISSEDKKSAQLQIMTIVRDALSKALDN